MIVNKKYLQSSFGCAKDIENVLIHCDLELSKMRNSDLKIDCYIAGGAAFILHGMPDRISRGIDVLKHTGNDILDISKIFLEHGMNCDVQAYFDNFPSGFAKRAVKLDIDCANFNFYILSVEDLVISKLCTTRFEQDLKDVNDSKIVSSIDWNLLDTLAKGMENTMISSLAYQNFVILYNHYKKEHEKDADKGYD